MLSRPFFQCKRKEQTMSKRLYAAYGSNLNHAQMKFRCPTAEYVGSGTLDGYALQFKGSGFGAFATVGKCEDASVPVGIWKIEQSDEAALDRYEGYPSHYYKENVTVDLGGEDVTAMVYIMNPKMDFGIPSSSYYRSVYNGYIDCGLDTDLLNKAMLDSAEIFYHSHPDAAGFGASDEDIDDNMTMQ